MKRIIKLCTFFKLQKNPLVVGGIYNELIVCCLFQEGIHKCIQILWFICELLINDDNNRTHLLFFSVSHNPSV